MGDPAIRRSGDPAIRRSGDPAIPDDLERIIDSEIRKELRGFEGERALPASLSHDDGRRRVVQGTHDPSRPILCAQLAAVALRGRRSVVEFLRLIRQGCAMVVDDHVFHGRRRGRKWTLDPAWLFRRAYLEERQCSAIAAEAGHATLNVVETLRRLSNRLQSRLLAALSLPPEVTSAILADAPISESVREDIVERLRAFVAPKDDGASA